MVWNVGRNSMEMGMVWNVGRGGSFQNPTIFLFYDVVFIVILRDLPRADFTRANFTRAKKLYLPLG